VALLAPITPEKTASALSVLGARLPVALDALPGIDVLADCGRIDSRSPALELARSARYVVFVIIPTLEGVAHCQARIEVLGLAPERAAVLTIGSQPYRADEVGAALSLPVLGSLAHDGRGSQDLAAGHVVRRSELLRSAAGVADRLATYLTPVVTDEAIAGVSRGTPSPPRAPPPAGRAPAWSPPETIDTRTPKSVAEGAL
jgi:hypothetical protein